MNLKQNAWMYLFFASVLLWVGTVTFSCEATPKTVGDGTKPTATCKIDSSNYELDKTTAMTRIGSYEKYALTFPSIDTSKLNKDSTGILVNQNVEYFHLPNCELSDMVAQVKPGADVKAHLAIKDVKLNGVKVKEIVLVFEAVKASDSETYYYDFVMPCPPRCPK